MSDDYLWDRSGPPDAELERLETLLGTFRHNQPAPDFGGVVVSEGRASKRRRLWWLFPAFAAACVLVWIVWHMSPQFGAWTVENVEGAPIVAGKPVAARGKLHAGEWLETGAGKAVLAVNDFGHVEVEPNTRLLLMEASREREQLRLVSGAIHAEISAPPYVFVVLTPSAYALDMGCAYTLRANPDGSSILEVTSGWVQFQHDGVQSMVPAGAVAETRPRAGPGAPYYADASESFREALQVINFNYKDAQARSAALTVLLRESRPKDAFTLINLFKRIDYEDRGRVYDRLAELVPPPPGTTREGVINRDMHMIDAWWDKLGVGHIKKVKKVPQITE